MLAVLGHERMRISLGAAYEIGQERDNTLLEWVHKTDVTPVMTHYECLRRLFFSFLWLMISSNVNLKLKVTE